MIAATETPAKLTKSPPCANCPWRRDSAGKHAAETVAILRPCATEGGPVQSCHMNRKKVCAGWIISVGRKDANFAFAAMRSPVDIFRDVRSSAELYPSFAEMFAAHGVTE